MLFFTWNKKTGFAFSAQTMIGCINFFFFNVFSHSWICSVLHENIFCAVFRMSVLKDMLCPSLFLVLFLQITWFLITFRSLAVQIYIQKMASICYSFCDSVSHFVVSLYRLVVYFLSYSYENWVSEVFLGRPSKSHISSKNFPTRPLSPSLGGRQHPNGYSSGHICMELCTHGYVLVCSKIHLISPTSEG